MSFVLRIVFSNRLEKLAEALAENLFLPGSLPFERRYVFVPNEQVREFLMIFLAKRLDIAAGIQILSLEQGLAELRQESGDSKRIPSFMELSLRIEEKMHAGLQKFEPLRTFIDFEGEEFRSQRIAAFSDQVALLFKRYGNYGGEFLSQWLEEEGWQQWIWHEIFSKGKNLTYPIEALRGKKWDANIHVFGFDHLPAPFVSFFSEAKAFVYQFSPCALYWDDLCSDREKLFLGEKMQGYLQDNHPLLGNWGKLGREFLKALDAYHLDAVEDYALAEEESALSSLQRDLLLMKTNAAVCDSSIQIHNAPSKLREIEVLRDVIETLLAQHQIEPKDVLVLAPEMSDYVPYIHMVFGSYPRAYRIEEGRKSDFAQALWHLLSLAEEPLSPDGVLKLVQSPLFRTKWGFSAEDISPWIERANIRTGEESWERGIDRLLLGLALCTEDTVNCVSQSEMDVLNQFLIFYRMLVEDLKELRAQEGKPIADWFFLIQEMAERYFDVGAQNEPLLSAWNDLLHQTKKLSGKQWTWSSIKRVFQHLYEKRGSSAIEQLQMITFCCLSRVRPARIIYLLGLDEENFPRRQQAMSLCALNGKVYIPTKTEEDRYHFLSSICSARDYLIMSYVRTHPKDNKPQGPSYILDELLSYLGKQWTVQEHPSERFDAGYFQPDSPVQNLQPLDFRLAQSYYGAGAEMRHFFNGTAQDLAQESIVSIQSLQKCARHPIKFYLTEVLGMYVKEEKNREESQFVLSSWDKYSLKRKALIESLQKIALRSGSQGLLPEGVFKDVALHTLNREVEEELAAWDAFALKPEDFFSVELSLHCTQAIKLENGNWILPPLTIDLDGKKIHVTGTLSDLTPQGMFVHAKDDLEGRLSYLPQFLILQMIETLPSALLFSKSKTKIEANDPQMLLKHYLEYYCRARSSLSPLMPKWASALLLKGESEFTEVVSKALEKTSFGFTDPYMEWIKRSKIALDTEKMYAEWADYLKHIFEPIINHAEV